MALTNCLRVISFPVFVSRNRSLRPVFDSFITSTFGLLLINVVLSMEWTHTTFVIEYYNKSIQMSTKS